MDRWARWVLASVVEPFIVGLAMVRPAMVRSAMVGWARMGLALVLCGALAASGSPAFASAQADPAGQNLSPRMVDGEERVTVAPSEGLDDDLIVWGSREVTVNGTVKGDLIIFGPEVVVTGVVEGDVIGYASRLRVHGSVLGNVRVASIDTIQIDGSVGRSLNTVAPSAVVGPQGKVGASWIAMGPWVELAGEVKRSLWTDSAEVLVSGRIGRDLTATSYTRATLGSTAAVGGTFLAVGKVEPTIEQGASVGDLRFEPPVEPVVKMPWMRFDRFSALRIAGFGLVGLLLAWLAPGLFITFRRRLSGHPWASLGVGVGLLAGVPMVAVVMMLTVAALPVTFLALLPLYAVAIYLGQILVAGWLGHWILSRIRRDERVSPYGAFLLGMVCLTLLTRLPYVHFVFSFASVALALGGIGFTFGPWVKRIAREV